MGQREEQKERGIEGKRERIEFRDIS